MAVLFYLDVKNKDVDIVSVFEAVGAHANKNIDDNELTDIESCAIPGPGSCGGMYTATLAVIEALGLSLQTALLKRRSLMRSTWIAKKPARQCLI